MIFDESGEQLWHNTSLLVVDWMGLNVTDRMFTPLSHKFCQLFRNVSIWFPEVGHKTGSHMQTHIVHVCAYDGWRGECGVHVRTLLQGCDSAN